ncbi:MAG: RidA family protein [Chloroflexus sp.]|jgi:endoribonuclease L-PSP|uniref:RidA family protein n=1 Tax=Chloroflexus sp. Y-396-1 TaxID=867845 RepID=UPI00048D5F3F|nr:RidA family protein [Chloroflexus sp. Y-396-1]MBO9314120.1 RidA family protein [Chloroflexus sp.]MBO9315560.1 RidA family protein [Chloroflexus sp.]MBO9319585.1 RidA family protein [Chloroflexus sp.]MBO9340112.1 RidA family protein [Chloroflexus sp.]MBO9375033.1 RidA family protein [Chloroflexus sp.]
MDRTRISTDAAPGAIGPYSQAIKVGNLIFVSGQLPINPATNELITDDIGAMTRQIFANIAAILQAAGSSLDRIVKTTVFLADLNDFAAMNAAYAEHFGDTPPARSTVQVARLPRDARIEIEAIALA